MIDAPDFLPLGSVVSLEGNDKKLMIIGRALILNNGDSQEYYDYSFCLYPEGMLGDEVIYSNHENIEVVHSEGFSDEEDAAIVDMIKAGLAKIDLDKADPKPIDTW